MWVLEEKSAADSAATDALVGNISQLGQIINAEEKTLRVCQCYPERDQAVNWVENT